MNNNIEQKRNNSGQGIFYAVIGIATLVVTIIGATFAYFSASAGSNENAITTSSATVKLKFTENPLGLKSNIIPVDGTSANFVTYPNSTSNGCVDRNSNNICSVYEFTVKNQDPSSASIAMPAQRIYVSLKAKTNQFVNLHYAIFKGTSAQVLAKTGTKFNVNGTAVTTVGTAAKHDVGTNGDLVVGNTQLTYNDTTSHELAALEQVLDDQEEVTYTVVIWLQETGKDQSDSAVTVGATGTGDHAGNTNEAGKSFEAGINITTVKGTAGITGVLSA